MLGEHNITVNPISLAIDEIQHADPLKITEHKVKAAYTLVRQPVVVNDSSWEIPALNGFPGGYMKDIAQWLTAEDFLRLMQDKEDRRIILHDVVVYCDGGHIEIFKLVRRGVVIEVPRGEGSSIDRIVELDGGGLTIAEESMRRSDGAPINPDLYQHWQSFARWFVERH